MNINPFRAGQEGQQKIVAAKIAAKFLGKNGGLMYKLFDLGNLAFIGTQAYVYKNEIGDSCRYFVKQLEANDFEDSFKDFKTKLYQVARLSCPSEKQYEAFIQKMNEIVDTIKEDL